MLIVRDSMTSLLLLLSQLQANLPQIKPPGPSTLKGFQQ